MKDEPDRNEIPLAINMTLAEWRRLDDWLERHAKLSAEAKALREAVNRYVLCPQEGEK